MDAPEILTMVIQNLTRRQQARCCRVSQLWYQCALPLVYEWVSINIVNGQLSPSLDVIEGHSRLIRALSVLSFSQELQDFVTEASDDIRGAVLATSQGQVGVVDPDILALFPRVEILTIDVAVPILSIALFVDNCPNLRVLKARQVCQQAHQRAYWLTSRCPRLREVEIHAIQMNQMDHQMTDRELAGAVQPSLRRFRVEGTVAIGRNTFLALQAAFVNLVRVDFYECTGTPAAVAKPILLHCPKLTHFLIRRLWVNSFYLDAAGDMLGDALTVSPQVSTDRSRFRNWLSTQLVTFQVHQLYWSQNVVRNNGFKNQLLRQNALRHLQMDRLYGSVDMANRGMMPGELWPRSTDIIPELLPWMNQHWPNLTTFRYDTFSVWDPTNVVA